MVCVRSYRPVASSRCCQLLCKPRVESFSTSQYRFSNDTSSSLESRPKTRHGRRGKVIFSGIQPTGVPHLGNYLGALRQWKQFQDEKTRPENPQDHRLLYSIVDLHALTHHQPPESLRAKRKATLASLLAIGLDPKHCAIFFQSDVPAHTQLMWYLNNFASTGYLSRMTQWKSKLGVSDTSTIEDQTARDKLKLGLFSYPVLQAADILLYNADIVPVGEDQKQHVEFTRTLARSLNSHYRDAYGDRDFFKIPEVLLSPAKRVMSLKDPLSKMSKSHADPNSRISIIDTPDEIHSKIKGALTDSINGISYQPTERPGVANLIEILRHVGDEDVTCEQIAADHANTSMRALKEHVANEIIRLLAGIRERFTELMDAKNDEIVTVMKKSAWLATTIANQRLRRLEAVMGLQGLDEPIHRTEGTTGPKMVNKEAVMREQQAVEDRAEHEPDVTPQMEQGIDRPIAS